MQTNQAAVILFIFLHCNEQYKLKPAEHQTTAYKFLAKI